MKSPRENWFTRLIKWGVPIALWVLIVIMWKKYLIPIEVIP